MICRALFFARNLKLKIKSRLNEKKIIKMEKEYLHSTFSRSRSIVSLPAPGIEPGAAILTTVIPLITIIGFFNTWTI